MDTERLGRVLGVGARHAGKTLMGAVEAAAAPHPSAATAAGSTSGTAQVAPRSAPGRTEAVVVLPPRFTQPTAEPPARHSAAQSDRGGSRRGLVEGGRRFGRAVWEPTARLSGVLWLEVTGLFFGIFVLVAATAAWRLRGAAHLAPGAANAQAHTELLMAIGMLLLFGYFAVSSFLAASRRGRKR